MPSPIETFVSRILPSCVANITNNREDFDRECAEAESYFNVTYNNGLWSLT